MTDKTNKTISDYIVRKYTKELEGTKDKTVYDLFQWKKVNVKLVDYKKNEVLYDEKDLEFPEQYSQNACDIIAQKYFKRANVPNELGKETSLKQIIHRMVRFWTEAGLDEGLLNEKTAKIFYDEVVYIMLDQRLAPNSPQWFNTGLKYYDTNEGTDGHFYFDIKDRVVKQSKDKYSRTQASACFILSIEDKLLGDKSIAEQYVTETRLFKHGSGTGTNFSTLRGQGEKLTGGGVSSGVLSFLNGLDRNAGTIKSGGTNRRSAKMVQLDVNHPEILDFITWKSTQEQIVRDLGKMDYDIGFDGIAYNTVSGQNGNNTVRFDDEFMLKVYTYVTKGIDCEYELVGRVDKSVNRMEKVSTIWNVMCQSIWDCADPAPSYDGTYNAWHTCPSGEDGVFGAKYNRINSTNPCGEYAFLDDTACNLASINAEKFYNKETNDFDLDLYLHTILLGQLILEFTVHWGQFPVAEVARRTHMFRTTGLGIANTASVHMLMGHAYDSDEARSVASSLMSIMTGYSYVTSALMAQQLGSFEKYEINKTHMMEVIRNHARVSGARNDKYERFTYKPVKLNHATLHKLGLDTMSKLTKDVWNNAIELGELHGYRNAQVTVIAPTGTIAFAMDCGATSIEPYFGHSIWKKLAGGGGMMMVNPLIPQTLRNLGYSDEEIEIASKQIEIGEIENCEIIKQEDLSIFDTANKCGKGQRYIPYMGHVKMMACLTPMVSGAISKTVNLPKETNKEEISNILVESYKLGVKGLTVYRDGSKASQPLNTTTEDINKNIKFEELKYSDLVKIAYKLQSDNDEFPKRRRPNGILNGKKHEAIIDGIKLLINVAFYDDGKLAEIYIVADKEGSLIKGLLDSLSKLISKMIQYSIPVEDIIRTLKGQKYEPHGYISGHPYIKFADSISDLVAKILEIEVGNYSSCQVKPKDVQLTAKETKILSNEVVKQYIKPKTEEDENPKIKGRRIYGMTCPECGSDKMVQNGVCKLCSNCGATNGCS